METVASQMKLYDALDYTKVFLNKKAVIHHFIESEKFAMEKVFQGKFYPMAHYEIKKIVKTKMQGFTEEEIVKTFFHTLRLANLYAIHKTNYPHIQKAINLLLPHLEESKYLICHFERLSAYLLFEVFQQSDKENIYLTTAEDYFQIREFIITANSYRDFRSMSIKSVRFVSFLDNKTLIQRVQKAVLLFSDARFHQTIGYDFTFGACVLLLLISTEKTAKDTLKQLHRKPLSEQLVWVLDSLYQQFQNTTANKELLDHLHNMF